MARKPKSISVYERIENVKTEIAATEQHLDQLRYQLEELYAEKDDLEMRETWSKIKNSGLTLDDIKQMLESRSNK